MCGKSLMNNDNNPNWLQRNCVAMHVTYTEMDSSIFYCMECFKAIAPQNLIEAMKFDSNQFEEVQISVLFDRIFPHHTVAEVHCPECGDDLIEQAIFFGAHNMVEVYKQWSRAPSWWCGKCQKHQMKVLVKYK
jgi:hypothetical protein